MANQMVRDQVENKIQLIAEVDSAISAVCMKVKNEDLCPEDYPKMVTALAELVAARAALN